MIILFYPQTACTTRWNATFMAGPTTCNPSICVAISWLSPIEIFLQSTSFHPRSEISGRSKSPNLSIRSLVQPDSLSETMCGPSSQILISSFSSFRRLCGCL